MNKEKTAMQMLIEDLQAIKNSYSVNTPKDLFVRAGIVNCIDCAKQFLQKEQEQIEKAFEDGQDYYNSNMNDKDYYQSKYGGEE